MIRVYRPNNSEVTNYYLDIIVQMCGGKAVDFKTVRDLKK